MSKDYLNTPLDATEMVTEIIGSDYHPFPIPPEIMERVQHLRDLVRPAGSPYEFLTFQDCNQYGPTFLSDWEGSVGHLGDVCSAISSATVQMGANEEGDLMRALTLALEREIIRQKGLWEWVRATLKFDPWISETVCAPPAAEETPVTPSTSSSAPQSEESDKPVPYPRFLDELNTWADKQRGLIRALQMMNPEIDHNAKQAIWAMAETLERQVDDLEELRKIEEHWVLQRPTTSSGSEGHAHT